METLAEKIKTKYKPPYQIIAERYGVAVHYVYMIATGRREPQRGKGAKILKDLQEMATQN